MKRKVMFSLFFLLILVSYFSAFALAELKTCEPSDSACKIDNGYSCLNDAIGNRTCLRLGSEDKVFSLISTGECKPEVVSDSKFKTDIKYTALALLGGASDNDAESWLVSKNQTATTIDWLLQVDTTETGELICDITYGTTPAFVTVVFNEDKTIKTIGGNSCLLEDSTGYWLKINSVCYNSNLKVSCDKSFATNLLYQKTGFGTIYVSDETHSSSADGETTEKVQSLCFGTTTGVSGCNYEGTLWAALVLNSLNYDVSPYIPYLVTNLDSNLAYLPEAFLYLLTGDFGNELLSKQKGGKWWQESSDKFYDTALALYAFQYDDSLQKQNAMKYLLDEAQSADGCWNSNNVRDTAFILYALEPRSPTSGSTGGDSEVDCESSGNYCMSGISCSQTGGNIISGLSCNSGLFVCCDEQKVLESCSVQGGEICGASQTCVGGTTALASDISSSEICCISGSCQTSSSGGGQQDSACVSAEGSCRIGSCLSGEEELNQACEFSTDVCCVQQQQSTSSISSLWIWVLLSLIALSI